jgi:hypothetical protein
VKVGTSAWPGTPKSLLDRIAGLGADFDLRDLTVAPKLYDESLDKNLLFWFGNAA